MKNVIQQRKGPHEMAAADPEKTRPRQRSVADENKTKNIAYLLTIHIEAALS